MTRHWHKQPRTMAEMAELQQSVARALQEHRDLSRRIAVLAISAVVLVVLVEAGWRVAFAGGSTPEWIVPLRLVPWLLLFLSFMGWMIHSVNKPVAPTKAKGPTVSPAAEPAKPAVKEATPEKIEEKPTVPTRVRRPYLLPAEPLVGRESERQRLTNWYQKGTSGVLVLHSRGGFGKTSLAWVWIHHDLMGVMLPGQPNEKNPPSSRLPEGDFPKGIFWWSFEEGHAPFSAMLDELVEFLAGKEASVASGSRSAKVDFVVDELSRRSVLVVLDGFEHGLTGFGYTSSHYHADKLSAASDPEDRRCLDPWASEFLHRMAAVREGGRVLVTTRHVPSELESAAAEGGPTAEIVELTGLDPNVCVSWMTGRGIKGDRTRQLVLARICNYRPLAIRLSIGMAHGDTHAPGDVNVVIENGQISKSQNPHQVIRAAIGLLGKPQRDLISRLSAIRGTIDRATLESVSTVGLGSKLDAVLTDFVDRGLLMASADRQRFQLHGLVRAAGYERLSDAPAFHSQLESRWAALGSHADPNSVAGLSPLVERFHHLTASGRCDQARELFRDQLSRWVLSRHGDFPLGATLYRSLFVDGLHSPPMMDKGSSNAATVRQMGEILSMMGEPLIVTELTQIAIDRSNAWRMRQTADIDLYQQAEACLRVGKLRQAAESIEQGVRICHQTGEKLRWAMGRELQARLLLIQGSFEDAASEVESALSIAESWKSATDIAQCLTTLAEVHLEAERWDDALEAAERAVAVAQPTTLDLEGYPIQAINAYRTLGRVLVARAGQGSPEDAANLLKAAMDQVNSGLRLAWRRNIVYLDPELRKVRASIYQTRGQADRALKEAEGALRLAKRVGARLTQVDLYVLMAQLVGGNEVERQQTYNERARELAWCDGSPHCYKAALEMVITRA